MLTTIIFLKKYELDSNNFFQDYYNKCFRYILHRKLSEIKNIQDCINVLQFFENTDQMCENIVNIFHNYNPTDDELQNYSILFDKYQDYIDNRGFAVTTLWLCVIQWIIEFEIFKKNNIINNTGIELYNIN